jgi:hypothetical protein
VTSLEAAAGHPLPVYVNVGQTRGFRDIRDTVRGIEIATLYLPQVQWRNVRNQRERQGATAVSELAY